LVVGDISDYWLEETLVIVDYGWQFLAMCGRVFLWVIDYGLLVVDCGLWVAVLGCAWKSFVVGG
jgi:hypothetical protein